MHWCCTGERQLWSLKLTKHSLKLGERVLEKIAFDMASIDKMKFGFVPCRKQLMLFSFHCNFKRNILPKKKICILPSYI